MLLALSVSCSQLWKRTSIFKQLSVNICGVNYETVVHDTDVSDNERVM